MSKSRGGGKSWSDISTGLGGYGYVSALAIDPLTPTTLYAGTYGHDVFTSTDGGGSWSASATGLPDQVTALAIDPLTPSTLYAGTEESGGFRSADWACTWDALNSGFTYPVVP